ncbi:MAG: DUF1707 domain-containing protein [Gemmatimonadetes bacterium]|nr:DUF1707 domain-containing protein [Gemmatimonadota bacterium]
MAHPHSVPVPLEQTREHVVQQLCEHFAFDNLTTEALEERLDRAHRAATPDDLRALVSDLPVVHRDAAPAPGARTFVGPSTGAHVGERQIIIGIMGGAEKKGVWTPARQIYVVAMMGGAHLDFRQARFGPGVTEVIVFAVMGGAEIVVPPGVHVDLNGVALMGGFSHTGSVPLPTDPAAPVLRIGGFALMGGVEVSIRYPGERPRDARQREKLDRQERRRPSGG